MAGEPAAPASSLSFDDLHAEVQLARGLFSDGYLQEAVRKAAERFVNRVGEDANRPDLSGLSLINQAFSEQQPLLVFTDERDSLSDQNLHNGFRNLAAGLTVAVRNIYTHVDHVPVSEIEALEWLSFISAMHRRLDRVEQVVEPIEGATSGESQSVPDS